MLALVQKVQNYDFLPKVFQKEILTEFLAID